MSAPEVQPAAALSPWTREVVVCGPVRQAPSAASVRLSGGAAIGSAVGVAGVLLAGAVLGRGESILIAAILACAAAGFWYITSRDRSRRDEAMARERDLFKSVTDVELRLASGARSPTRQSALADLAEWIALRSRLNGGQFDLDAWRRFTIAHGTPVAIALGIPVPAELPPTYEAIDLESERPGLSRARLRRLGLIACWFALILSRGARSALDSWTLLWVAALIGMALYEFGIQPVSLSSFVVSPGRVEAGSFRRTRVAEAGASVALIESRPGGGRLHPPNCVLTILGGRRPISFALRHERDARIAMFLASWLTPREGAPPDQGPAHEPRSHHPPHGAVPAGPARAAGGASV